MIPTVTAVRMSGARDREQLPLLVLGPSLGTSARTLWGDCAAGLTGAFDVLAWDLPGHGYNTTVPEEGFTVAELAAGVLRVVDDVCASRDQRHFHVAGDSVGGLVALQLALDVPERVLSVAIAGSGARVAAVAAHGTVGPEVVDERGYAQVREAVAGFDVRDRLAEIGVPVLAIAGSADVTTPPATVRELADGVRDGRYVELEGVAHLAPAASPDVVARLLLTHALGEAAGVTAGFEQLVRQYAAGPPPADPALDPRSRSLVALTALALVADEDRFAGQVRAALAEGLTAAELQEVLLAAAVHGGVPAAAPAFRTLQQVLTEEGLA